MTFIQWILELPTKVPHLTEIHIICLVYSVPSL